MLMMISTRASGTDYLCLPLSIHPVLDCPFPLLILTVWKDSRICAETLPRPLKVYAFTGLLLLSTSTRIGWMKIWFRKLGDTLGMAHRPA